MKSHSFFLGLGLFMLALHGCSNSTSSSQGRSHAPSFERPLPVKTAEVTVRNVPVFVEVIGNIVGSMVVDVRPQVSGRIVEVYINGGQDVRQGDLLYKIDPEPYEIALEQAKATLLKDEAQLEFAKRKLERYSEIKSDFVAKLSLEEFKRDVRTLESQVKLDYAQVDLAKLNLDYCFVKAPISGRIHISTLDIGNLVTANDPNALTQIIQLSPIMVYFSISQKEFQEFQKILQQGRKQFDVLLPFGSQDVFKGEVVAINNQIDQKTGTIRIKGEIPNEKKILWPGEFVRVRLFIRMKNRVPAIPSGAIQTGQKGSFVYVLNPDHTVRVVYVKTAEVVDRYTVIDEGLEPGMIVVTDGQENLKAGAKVMTESDLQQMTPQPTDSSQPKGASS